MPRFKKLQVGGHSNEVLVGLDESGVVWFNRGGVESSDWVVLDTFDAVFRWRKPSIVSIALWGEQKDMLEALDENGEAWSFDGLLDPPGVSSEGHPGAWIPSNEHDSFEGEDAAPFLVEFVAGRAGDGRGNELFALDREGRIWAFDAELSEDWFQIPMEIKKDENEEKYDGIYDA